MATVLESILPKRSVLLCVFCGQKDIHKEMLPVYGGKCLSRKAVHSWVEEFSQGRSKVADDARPGADVIEITVNIFLCCAFQFTGKATGHMYQCWWRICQEIKVFFSRFEYHMFYVLHPFVIYLLALPLII
jgi:hypothetical protein